MMATAGVDWLTALFRNLGPQYLAEFMGTTGEAPALLAWAVAHFSCQDCGPSSMASASQDLHAVSTITLDNTSAVARGLRKA